MTKAPGIGHNSGITVPASDTKLVEIVDRLERLDSEKSAVLEDIKEVFAEAKGSGFDVKVLRAVLRRRKQDERERQEQDELIETYERALLTAICS